MLISFVALIAYNSFSVFFLLKRLHEATSFWLVSTSQLLSRSEKEQKPTTFSIYML